jgi:WD40 repeat protein
VIRNFEVLAVLTLGSTKVTRTVRFYNQSSGEPWMSWSTTQKGDIITIAISRDNKILASGNEDSTILLYNISEQKAVNGLLRGHTRAITSLSFSRDGKILASGSDDGTVRLWDVQTGKNICDPLAGETYGGVSSVAFSPDMKQLIIGEINT